MSNLPEDLMDLVFFPDMDAKLLALSQLAEKEDWGYRSTPERRKLPVLFNYLVYTYKRLVQEEKIEYSTDKQQLCFNTGLVTEKQEEIFVVASTNRIPDRQPWHFTAWCKRSANELRGFQNLPEVAEYYLDPSVLVFDLSPSWCLI
jgi:hypothetical protein